MARSYRSMAAALLVFLLPSQTAYAACFDPAGATGEIIYNADDNVPQVCTAISGWVALGILNAAAGSGGCTNPMGAEGEVVYNADVSKPQYCDGANWVVMTGGVNARSCSGPADCPNIGNQCTDTTTFAGCHPVTYQKMFVHPNNQSAGTTWSSESVDTGADDNENGKVNQDWVVANKTITDYPAFKLCKDLNDASALGYTDWYLPSRIELYYMWSVSATINAGPGDNFVSTGYWTSSDISGGSGAVWLDFSDGTMDDNFKTTNYDVRCMRRTN